MLLVLLKGIKMKDKISVIIPCYNAENYIDYCLHSLECQTYVTKDMGDIEIILIDDASTDGTYDRLLAFEQRYPENVLVVACENNLGPGTIRNIGLEYATGTYVSFVDADDVVDTTMLGRMYEIMKLYDVDVVECDYKTFSDITELSAEKPLDELSPQHSNSYLLRIEKPKDRGQFVLNSLKTAVWGRLYKKSFLNDNDIYFPENMIYGEDNFFSGLAMLFCKSYYKIGENLYYYYMNSNGISLRANDNERIQQLNDIMKLYIKELDARGFFDVPNSTLSGYVEEFEWYMIYKYFMDPVRFVLSREFSDWQEQSVYFGRELLRFFPKAYNNIYLNNDKALSDFALLLKNIGM